MQIQSEQLAYWYFRLNGFLNIPNFVVHPDTGDRQCTDVDLLGVRFPYREELFHNPTPMRDDGVFTRLQLREKTHIVLAEVKTGLCSLNGPWTNREGKNMQRVLRAVGMLPPQEVETAAAALYECGIYSNQLYQVSLFCLGKEENQKVANDYPEVLQITWEHTLKFIYRRFRDYRRQKTSHPQWDDSGQLLWDCALSRQSRTVEDFVAQVEVTG